MSERVAPPSRKPRLNPFAFPSDTTLRFVLLATFVVCGSGLLYGKLRGPTDQAAIDCVSRVWSELSKLNMSSPADAHRNAAIIRQDIVPLQAHCSKLLRPAAMWRISGMLLSILTAAIIYYLYPIYLLKKGRFEPISTSELPELIHELRRLVEASRLPDPPTFVWNPLATGLPLAFGRRGRYNVALSGSFVSKYFYNDKNAFRAVILHELAHIKNGDVHKTYSTISLLAAFMAVSIAPSLLVSLWRLVNSTWTDATLLFIYILVWTSVVMLSGLSVLRVREYYADIQASVWDQTSEIDRVLAALPSHVHEGWRRYLRFHPSSKERREVIEDPSRLFGLSFAAGFGIGVATWSVIDVVVAVLLPFMPLSGSVSLILFSSLKVIISAAIFVFAVGAIGIGVWRSAFASLVKGEHPSKGTRWLGAALVAGSVPGIIVSAVEMVLERPLPLSAMLNNLQIEIATYLVLLVGCVLIFRWIAGAASAWFEVALQSRSPRPVLLLSVATALVLVVGTLASASFVVVFSFSATPWREWGPSWIYSYGLAAGGPILLSSIAVWAFPLAAPWCRRGVEPTELAGWVFLDGASPELPNQEPLRARGALLTGIVMGLIFWLLWELIYFRAYFPSAIGDGIYSGYGLVAAGMALVSDSEGFRLPGTAVCFQALAAAIAAGRARRLSVVHGLFAAFVAGCVIIAGDWIFFGIRFDVPVSELTLATLIIMGLGAAVALPTAILAAWIGNVTRSFFSGTSVFRTPISASSGLGLGTSSHPRETSRRKGLLSKGCAAVLCIVVAIGMAVRIREQVVPMQEVSAIRKSAESGDSDAQNKLGALYANGQSVAQDDVQAVFWWSEAAAQGNADAQFSLAQMYFAGRGVAQDEAMAFPWVRRAAEQGHAEAETVLGVMYAAGRGVSNDDVQALQWFNRAAEQGNTDAQNNLGIFYASGRGTPRDDAAAVQWLRKAAERGHADAQKNLGLMYQQGRALPKDDVLAMQWFRSAAEQGHPHAEFLVGEMYEKGEVVAKDDEQAIAWFRKAAAQSLQEANTRLQVMCDRGLSAACSK